VSDELSAQRYDARQVQHIAKAVSRLIGTAEAGKVYCPYCRFREARWKRHFDEGDADLVHLFVYCTQCHKTGVTDFRQSEMRRSGLANLLNRVKKMFGA